jgi:hypothetical protein
VDMDGCREDDICIMVRNGMDGFSLGGGLLLHFTGIPPGELVIAGPVWSIE